jgi:hypothetical protein
MTACVATVGIAAADYILKYKYSAAAMGWRDYLLKLY